MTKSERTSIIDGVLNRVRPLVEAELDRAPRAAAKPASPKVTPAPKAAVVKAPAIVVQADEPITRHFVAELNRGQDWESYGAVKLTRWIEKKGALVPIKSITIPVDDVEYVTDVLIEARRYKEALEAAVEAANAAA